MNTSSAAPTYLYGAGRMGREVLAHCRAQGIEPKAFIDRAAARMASVDGVPVVTPDEAIETGAGGHVVVALHSPGVNIAGVVENLRRAKFAAVRTLWDECDRSAWLPQSPFWLEPHFDWVGNADSIARARALLDDETSRRVFDQQLALRRDGDYAALGAPTPDDQYMPRDLPRWREPMCLVDCGAYDGDTLRALAANEYAVEDFVALEPDPENYARLSVAWGNDTRGRLIAAGAWSSAGTLSFKAGEGGAAHLDEGGDTTIAVVRIDDLCADFHPTMIKMDIEGAERAALDGASKTVARDRPDLALSVYHHLSDLWEIALKIDDWRLGYRFHLRSHAYNGFDTVLYAVASR